MRVREAKGTVKDWSPEEGWGVLVSPDVPDEVWAGFWAIEGSGFKELLPGEPVEFRYRPGSPGWLLLRGRFRTSELGATLRGVARRSPSDGSVTGLGVPR